MIINIPNYDEIHIKNIVFDMNGTIAENGIIDEENRLRILELSKIYKVFILTADTYGTIERYFTDTKVCVNILKSSNGTKEKKEFIEKIGKTNTIAVGNGSNDAEMIKTAKLGICIIGSEGASKKALLNSDIIFNSFKDVYKALMNTKRIIATLRE
ncbi:HAD family hydrolase [Helicovermis profundi]|uniref:HAD hydrolase family protein n=1 Tax=Helicovermis profundi TaxID=3065157 RepID=A0AAU9EUE4_9FIRM|nr:HAD hydrolase family protein [Clostridia bacterium S502]